VAAGRVDAAVSVTGARTSEASGSEGRGSETPPPSQSPWSFRRHAWGWALLKFRGLPIAMQSHTLRKGLGLGQGQGGVGILWQILGLLLRKESRRQVFLSRGSADCGAASGPPE
jgi:hypothetical protein